MTDRLSQQHRVAMIEDMRRDPGYALENVAPVSADERDAMASWLEAHAWAERHEHDGYGWASCSSCRRREAIRVSSLFPPPL